MELRKGYGIRDAMKAVAISLQIREPLLLVGAPGTGKTAMVQAVSKRLGLECQVLIGSIIQPHDLAVPVVLNGKVDFKVQEILLHLNEVSGVLFIDEIDKAPRSVQAALLTLILNHRIHNTHLPNLKFVSAANPMEEGGESEIIAPLINRLIVFPYQPLAQEVIRGFRTNWELPPLLPTVNPKDLKAKEVYWRNLVATFLERFPTLSIQFRDDGQPFPSPRTWEKTAKVLAAAEVAGEEEVGWAMAEGLVGTGAVEALRQFVKSLSLPSFEDVLSNPEILRRLSTDELMVVLGSLASHAALDDDDIFTAVVSLIPEVAAASGKDFGIIFVELLKPTVATEKRKEIITEVLLRTDLPEFELFSRYSTRI